MTVKQSLETVAILHAFAESLPDLAWVTRSDGNPVYFNQRWLDYTGLSRQESEGPAGRLRCILRISHRRSSDGGMPSRQGWRMNSSIVCGRPTVAFAGSSAELCPSARMTER